MKQDGTVLNYLKAVYSVLIEQILNIFKEFNVVFPNTYIQESLSNRYVIIQSSEKAYPIKNKNGKLSLIGK